jgi:hypothetical protein
MHAGRQSWRFEVSFSQLPHLVLFVRDTLGIEVGGNTGVPPQLAHTVPDLSSRLEEAVRRQAGTEWEEWWEAAVGLDGGGSAAAREGGEALREYGRRVVAVVDPLEWRSLAGRPALRRALVATFEDGLRFADSVRDLGDPPARPDLFRAEVVRDAAESVADAAGVPVSSLDARADVVDVHGRWWVVSQRGQLLCSAEAARDAEVASQALMALFGSLV